MIINKLTKILFMWLSSTAAFAQSPVTTQPANPQLPPEVVAAYEAMNLSDQQKYNINPQITQMITKAHSAIKREALRDKYPSKRRIKQKVSAAFTAQRSQIVKALSAEQLAAFDNFSDTIVAIMTSSNGGANNLGLLTSKSFGVIQHDH